MEPMHVYRPLGTDSIRLLRLRQSSLVEAELKGELVTGRLMVNAENPSPTSSPTANEASSQTLPTINAGDFDVLPYSWDQDSKYIRIYDRFDVFNGITSIKRNLDEALRTFRAQLRPDHDDLLCVDALCINQGDNNERSTQIEKIGSIYELAKEVRVWLGPGNSKNNSAMSFLRGLDDVDATEHLITDGNNRCCDSFHGLMHRELVNRRWIVQEIALARNAKVCCGNEVITWDDFMFAVSLLVEKVDDIRKVFHQSPEFDSRHDYLGEVGVMSA
jgi:hypothetical protein